MPRSEVRYTLPSDLPPAVVREDGIESGFIGTLQGLKYDYRPALRPTTIRDFNPPTP